MLFKSRFQIESVLNYVFRFNHCKKMLLKGVTVVKMV